MCVGFLNFKKYHRKISIGLSNKIWSDNNTKQNSAFKEFFLIQGIFFYSSNPELLALVFWKQQPVVLQKSYFFYSSVLFFIFLWFQDFYLKNIYAKKIRNISWKTKSQKWSYPSAWQKSFFEIFFPEILIHFYKFKS